MKSIHIFFSFLTFYLIFKASHYLPPSSHSSRFLQNPTRDISLPSNSFSIADLYDIFYEFTPPNNITIAIKFNIPDQYFALGFGSGMEGADIWVFQISGGQVRASDRHGVGHVPPVLDTADGGKDNLEVLGSEVTPSYSLVKLTRELKTGDPFDAVISNGSTPLIWATAGGSENLVYHGPTRGLLTVNLKLEPENLIGNSTGSLATQPVQYGSGQDIKETFSNTVKVHAIINAIAWLILTDLGILLVRLLRGRKLHVGKFVIPVQVLHAGVMLTAVIMSVVVTATMIHEFLRDNGSGKTTGIRRQDFHYINGLVILTIITVTLLSGLVSLILISIRKRKVDPNWTLTMKKFHRVLGVLLYLDTKANVITGALIFDESKWKLPLFIYIGVVLILHLLVQFRISWGFIFANKSQKSKKRISPSPKQSKLVAAINQGKSRDMLLQEFPDISWVILGNKIYDLSYWIHPGGNNIIKACCGREIGRYFYGNHPLEDRNLKPHKHSAMTLSQIKSLQIGEVTCCESILFDVKGEKAAVTKSSSKKDNWKMVSMKPITETVAMISFENENYKVKNFGDSLSWLGRHFRVSFNNERSKARLYTTALSLSDANTDLRHEIFKYFDDALLSEDSPSTAKDLESYTKAQDYLPLFIKNYAQFPKGLSNKIHQVQIDDIKGNNFRIEGPLGRGLEMTPESLTGKIVILCAGTGILPLIDFLNLFLWKNMYEILKEKAGVEKAEKINVLGLPFDKWMNELNVTFMGSFADEKEVLGLDIIRKLAEISKRFGTGNFKAIMKGYGDDNIEKVEERFSNGLLKRVLGDGRQEQEGGERFLVVGPPKFNKQAMKDLQRLGVKREKIMLV